MDLKKRPYIIIPKLIQQPTWGGNEICRLKSWRKIAFLQDKIIGQSYELFGNSKLVFSINSSSDSRFLPELGPVNQQETSTDLFSFKKNIDFFVLSDLVAKQPVDVLGKKIFERFGKMPLLIKINQAQGNSYQLHIPSTIKSAYWQPKAESWYFLEPGLVTFGITKNADLKKYKKVCLLIEKKMNLLSEKVLTKKLSLAKAQDQSAVFIKKLNPRQFTNPYSLEKFSLVDLSIGGIHHSWEEDLTHYPKGNIVFEIQQDVMDPVSTIRCFDQGKFKRDGSIRKVNIEDYFLFLNKTPHHNVLQINNQQKENKNLLTTPFYSLDKLEIKNRLQEKTNNSFVHLFVREGAVEIISEEGSVFLFSGHSCFIPEFAKNYEIKTTVPHSVVLKSYIS